MLWWCAKWDVFRKVIHPVKRVKKLADCKVMEFVGTRHVILILANKTKR